MPGNGGVYAAKRRKKPVQKNVKPPPVKTNPSKRHRDRLNGELDRLTDMLPFSEEARGRLDKLSVLRLSVGYLKVKTYFHALFLKHSRSAPLTANGTNGQSVSVDGVGFSEGELLLQALNGFVLVVATDGTIFYTSPTIQDFLGFHQSDVVQQSVHDLVHVDDREAFRCQLHFALKPPDTHTHTGAEDGTPCSRSVPSQYVPPENSSFLERSFCCRLRCLKDNTSGFLALNFTGRLKYLPGHKAADGAAAPPQLALFAIATPLQPPAVMEIRTRTLIFQTKHRMDFAPVGIDTRGKLVLGYTEIELVTTGSGYQFIHAGDMMYCADNHLRMMKTGDSGFTFFRLLTKTGHWLWVQANARIVFKAGKPDFIVARQKALTNEEGEEHLRQRRQQLPFHLATGEGVLYDVSLESIPGPAGSAGPIAEKPLDPASLLGSLRRQDQSIYTQPQKPGPQLPIFSHPEDADLDQPQASLEQAFLDSHALLSVPGQTQAPQKRSLTGDLTSDAMMDSLEEILGVIGGAGIEGLEDSELRDWEDTLARMKEDREDLPRELDHVLANDVFSYVEEALRRETGVCVQGPPQTEPVYSGSFSSFQPAGFLHSEWQQVTGVNSTQAEQPLLGGGGSFGRANGLTGASQVLPHTHASSLSCSSHRMTSTHTDVTQHSWVVQNSCSSRQPGSDVQFGGLQQVSVGPDPSVWQQQQSFQPSHTAGGVNSPFLLHTQRLSGSCMYEKGGHTASGRGATHNPSCSPRPPNSTDLRTNRRLSGAPSAPENASLQPPLFCWSGEAQIPRVPLNGAVDPFAFAALPTGSVNLSQNSGS